MLCYTNKVINFVKFEIVIGIWQPDSFFPERPLKISISALVPLIFVHLGIVEITRQNIADLSYLQIRYMKTLVAYNALPIAYAVGTFCKCVPGIAVWPIGPVAICVQLYQKID